MFPRSIKKNKLNVYSGLFGFDQGEAALPCADFVFVGLERIVVFMVG